MEPVNRRTLPVLSLAAVLASAAAQSLPAVQSIVPRVRSHLSLQFSSYVGGGSFDFATVVAADRDGNVYVAGNSQSRDFAEPVPLPPNQAWLPRNRTFVVEIDRRGHVVYTRLFEDTTVSGLVVDRTGSVYLAGTTAAFSGRPNDAYVVKLDRTGDVVYSRVFGGSGAEYVAGLAIDNEGGLAIAGNTSSEDFPLMSPAQRCTTAFPSRTNAFVARFNHLGELVRSTCLGGSGYDYAADIEFDARNNVYVLGTTSSADFPTTAGTFQQKYAGGTCAPPSGRPCNDAFIVKLDGAGPRIAYSTYFGGASEDVPSRLAVDGAGHAYIGGWTRSRNLPTARPLQADCRPSYSSADCGDGFVAKISPDGGSLVYGTYLGGSRFDSVEDLATLAGSLYVVGDTTSSDFLARQASTSAGNVAPDVDVYVLQMDDAGSGVELKKFGGSGDDRSASIAVDGRGTVYIAGYTRSIDFPVIDGFHKTFRGGDYDGFIAQLGPDRLPWPRRTTR